MMNELVTINTLKEVVSRMNKDVMSLKGNSMMKVSDLVSAFEDALGRKSE